MAWHREKFTLIVVVSSLIASSSAWAQDDLEFLLYQEGFETGLPEGDIGDVGDVGWDIGNSSELNSGIWHPGIGTFRPTTPLGAPADGNQALFLDDLGESGGPFDNTFVAVNTRIVIQEDATYRITAATGHAVDAPIGDQSIQAWVQPPPLDGGIDRRGFVGQSFTTLNWEDAEEGLWVDNSVEFVATPDLLAFNPGTGDFDILVVGAELIILVTNFNTDCCGIPGGQPGAVYWDNFRVTSDTPTPNDGLQAGDADQDLDFDQLDLVQVQIAAKYLTGLAAQWGEGDWDGAPGGAPGSPPAGDGLFDQRDIIAALASGTYLTGPYAAVIRHGQPEDEQISIGYNAISGEVWVDAPAGNDLTSINIDSAAGIFTGLPSANLGGSFDNDSDANIFKATFGSSLGSISFGNVAQTGLSKEFVESDLTVVGSLAGGGDLGNVDFVYVPEPTSVTLLVIGVLGLWGCAQRWPVVGTSPRISNFEQGMSK